MLILLIPIIIPLLMIMGFFLIIRRRYYLGAILIIGAIIANHYTQTYPLHPTYFTANKEKSQYLRILIYNLGLNNKYLNDNIDNLHDIEQFFSSQDADILVLPESRLWKKKELRKALEDLYPYNIASAFPNKEIYIETFIYSRYPLYNVQQIREDYSYMANIQIGNDSIKLIACHLSSNQVNSKLNGGDGLIENLKNGYRRRLEDTNNICNAVKDWNGPILLCGDLNDMSGSSTLNNLQDHLLLNDAWWQRGFGYGATFNSKGLYLRLDHILYSSHFNLEFIDIPNVNYSDHYPIVADFTIE